MKVTNRLANYIAQQHISPERVAMDTGVALEKLVPETKETLEAGEFLELCLYLGIRPEDMDGRE